MMIGDDEFTGFFSMRPMLRRVFSRPHVYNLPTFEEQLRAAVDADAVRTLFHHMPDPINVTDIETVQTCCIETIKSRNVNEEVLKALAEFRGFHQEAIPNFVFTSGLACGQQEYLTQIFLDSGYKPKIIGVDHIDIPPSVTDLVLGKILRDTCGKHGTTEEMPYYYLHRPGPEININGKITVDGPVECNLITAAFRKAERHDEKKSFLTKMETVPTAAALFEGGARSILLADDNKTTFGPNIQFGFSRFGALVHALASSPAHAPKEGHTQAFRLTCRNLDEGCGHAMALYLRKESGMLKTYLYDPNVTANMKHLSLPYRSKAAISALTFQNFVKDRQFLRLYCGDSGTLSIGGLTNDFAKEHAGLFVDDATRLNSIGDALCMGNATHIDAIAGQFMRDKNALAAHLATNIAILKQALFYALQDGHGDAIRAFGRLLAIAEIKEKDSLAELLTAKNKSNGVPGLFMALQQGHTDAILAFGELLAIAHIPNPDRRADVVTDRLHDGTSGFYGTFWHNRPRDVSAYGAVLKSADIDETRQDVLLMPKDSVSGTLGVDIALMKGYAGTICAFGAVLKSLGITDKERLHKLLAPHSARHLAALERARKNGYADTITAYDALFSG